LSGNIIFIIILNFNFNTNKIFSSASKSKLLSLIHSAIQQVAENRYKSNRSPHETEPITIKDEIESNDKVKNKYAFWAGMYVKRMTGRPESLASQIDNITKLSKNTESLSIRD